MLQQWTKQVDWQKLLNKQSSTWRALSSAEQDAITDAKSAITIMQKYSSIIKRPVITNQAGKVLAVGFNAAAYTAIFG